MQPEHKAFDVRKQAELILKPKCNIWIFKTNIDYTRNFRFEFSISFLYTSCVTF